MNEPPVNRKTWVPESRRATVAGQQLSLALEVRVDVETQHWKRSASRLRNIISKGRGFTVWCKPQPGDGGRNLWSSEKAPDARVSLGNH